jgi:hypothetical protein
MSPDTSNDERAEFERRLRNYLAMRDAVVITRVMLADLARDHRDAQDAAYALLGTRRPFA